MQTPSSHALFVFFFLNALRERCHFKRLFESGFLNTLCERRHFKRLFDCRFRNDFTFSRHNKPPIYTLPTLSLVEQSQIPRSI